MVKNPSARPPQNYYLGPLSESVHEMDGLSPKSWSVVHMDRWTDGRSADGRVRLRRPDWYFKNTTGQKHGLVKKNQKNLLKRNLPSIK